jgi:predicted MPP superfamily phosphohydrolase
LQTLSLLLYHTPDLIETADREEIDLYLAGHTHGGQVRLPFFGAIVTMSAYGKQYEMGLYQLNPTTLYVSRGVGMEGMGLPRVRFLCPPEIVLIELGAGSQQ